MPQWIVKGRVIGIAGSTREAFVGRYEKLNDPVLTALNFHPTTRAYPGTVMPPNTPDAREAAWNGVHAGAGRVFDVYELEHDERCIGEAVLLGVSWPAASADYGLIIFDEEDRAKGYGTEATLLVIAYAFDGLGLNRVEMRFLASNPAVTRAVSRSAESAGAREVGRAREAHWAFGRHQDVLIVEFLRSKFPPHPATAFLREPPAPL